MSEFDPVRFVEAHEWTFASTMKDIPHEYVVRGKRCSAEDWDAMWAYIRENGVWRRWFSRTNIYLDVAEHRYWMIWPIINREKLAYSKTVPLGSGEAEAASRLTVEVPVTTWGYWETGLYRYPVPTGEQSRLFEEER